jgi:cobalamin biosynthesis protein CobT
MDDFFVLPVSKIPSNMDAVAFTRSIKDTLYELEHADPDDAEPTAEDAKAEDAEAEDAEPTAEDAEAEDEATAEAAEAAEAEAAEAEAADSTAEAEDAEAEDAEPTAYDAEPTTEDAESIIKRESEEKTIEISNVQLTNDVTETIGQDSVGSDANADLEIDLQRPAEMKTLEMVQQLISRHTYRDLKEMCRENGLSIHGKKQDLACRIIEHNGQESDVLVIEE